MSEQAFLNVRWLIRRGSMAILSNCAKAALRNLNWVLICWMVFDRRFVAATSPVFAVVHGPNTKPKAAQITKLRKTERTVNSNAHRV